MLRQFLTIAMAAALAAAGAADTFTVATFSDPSPGASQPLFSLSGSSFSGGWSDVGLDLRTPGLAAPDFLDATMEMDTLAYDPNSNSLTGGQIRFFDTLDTLVFSITFSAAKLYVPFGFGAADGFEAENVVFGGTAVTSPLTAESFAFSFANQRAIDGGLTVTSAFTSSAAPEPASLALLAIGGLFGIRRRT